MMEVAKPVKKEEKIVYENQYSYVYSQEVDFGSFTKQYFVTNFGEKAGVLVIRDGAVLLVQQYRLLIDRPAWEIPGGKVEAGETPQESIMRECFEETGVKCRNLKTLTRYQQTLENVNSPTHIFYTEDFDDSSEFTPNVQEVERIQWVPFEQCLAMVKNGEITDSFSILAFFAYKFYVTEQKPLNSQRRGL